MTLLRTENLRCGYANIEIVRDLALSVDEGEVVALLGPNGAGKTTTLMTIAGVIPPLGGAISYLDRPAPRTLHRRARAGMGLLTERRSMFMGLTVRDNVKVAGVSGDDVLEMFPELAKRWSVRAGMLSGGEQQMLALGRVLARRPRLLLLDELSLGLAPLIVARLLKAVREAADVHHVGVLLVEQHARQALRMSDRGYVMRRGQIELEGSAAELIGRSAELQAKYLDSKVTSPPKPLTHTT